MLGLFAGPAVTYAPAYFWCVPEALGGWGLLQSSDDLMHRKGTASAV